MNFTQIRHGSHLIEYKDKTYLIDPVFADKGSMAALPMGRVKSMNPLVAMPFDYSFIAKVDALILTHLHFDHFDDRAKEMLPKDIQVYCHVEDEKKVRKDGFTNITGVDGQVSLGNDVSLRTVNGGQHGKGIRRLLMGRTTGYVIQDQGQVDREPTVYVTGDSIWCDSMQQALDVHKPEVIIAFAGEAKLMGGAITMGTGDLDALADYVTDARIIVNHLDTWNHCYLTRASLQRYIEGKGYKHRMLIPEDGETMSLLKG